MGQVQFLYQGTSFILSVSRRVACRVVLCVSCAACLTRVREWLQYGFEALVYNEFVERVVGGIPGKAIIDQTTEGLSVWTDVGVLGGMTGFYLLVAYLALQFLHKEKR